MTEVSVEVSRTQSDWAQGDQSARFVSYTIHGDTKVCMIQASNALVLCCRQKLSYSNLCFGKGADQITATGVKVEWEIFGRYRARISLYSASAQQH